MLRTGIVIDPRYQKHDAGAGHPERPERIASLLESANGCKRKDLVKLGPRPATRDELLRNHDVRLIDAVEATAEHEQFGFDPDTRACRQTWDTARLAAGGSLVLVESIMKGQVDNGFALVRPPGHHAESDRAMGFCFFNNVAIAAHTLVDKYELDRVLIMDFDVHHGNGTQRSFYASNRVLYVSTHQYPYYPGTGGKDEIGREAGTGYTVNIPLPAGCADAEYIDAFEQVVEPVSRQFDPQFVLISAGYDSYASDHLGCMLLPWAGITAMTRSLLRVAADHCRNRCAAVLEGGYNLQALSEGVGIVLDEMGGENLGQKTPGGGRAAAAIASVRDVHRQFWSL